MNKILVPLEEITNEDLIECYHLSCSLSGYDYTMDFDSTLSMANHWFKYGGKENIANVPELLNLIYSKGYFIPDKI